MKLLILHDRTFELTPSMLMQIEEAVPGYKTAYHPADSVTIPQAADAEIVFGCPPVGMLKHMPFLKWHHLPNSGIEPYVRPDLYATLDVMLTNSRGVYGAVIAEHVIGMIFSLARCFPLYARQQREELWQRGDYGCVWVEGSTAAVFGMGDIGTHVSQKLKALGAYVVGIRRSLFEKPPFVDELYDMRAAREVLARSDFVVCCLPPTSQTEGLFSEELLRCMKPSAYFINVSRGSLVNTGALVEALETGQIAGAALDVTSPEPPPPGHPLWTLENVILTPHAACVCNDIQERKLELFLRLLTRYSSGRRLLTNQVSFIQGY